MNHNDRDDLRARIRVLESELSRRDKTGQDLLERLENLNSLIDNLPGMAFRCLNDEDLTFDFASRGALAMLGYEPSDLVHGNAFRKLVHPDDQPENRKILAGISAGNRRYQMIYRIRAASGDDHWVKEEGTAVFSESGEFTAIEGLLTDITDQKRAEIRLREENSRLRSSIKDRYRLCGLVGKSPAMQRVYDLILKAAATDASVIVTGESGTGKELAARAIHDMSERSGGPFIAVNCGAIPENLLESEFFGTRKGAFTGAHADREGYLDAAGGGTLFLDEVGEISISFQVKLLRALDGKGYMRVGDHGIRNSDFRLIAATNRDIRDLVRKGRMREDFYYRINTVLLPLPPLRDRREDIPLLIDHFLEPYSGRSADVGLPPDIQRLLVNHSWPGNVRELQNVIQRYMALNELDFGQSVAGEDRTEPSPAAGGAPLPDLTEAVAAYERKLIVAALEQSRWHVSRCAEALGMSRRTLQRKMKLYRIK